MAMVMIIHLYSVTAAVRPYMFSPHQPAHVQIYQSALLEVGISFVFFYAIELILIVKSNFPVSFLRFTPIDLLK